MLEFLGALMGMSFRSGILLDINISRFIWKQIVGKPLTRKDLILIDDQQARNLDDILNDSGQLSDQEFQVKYGSDFTMSTLLSDGSVVDLVEGGRDIPLTKSLAQEFYDKALKVRLEESKAQVQALINGIHKTFDKKFLRMISWRFLEHRVVGACEVSVDRLKEITAYRGCTD
jgi:hypothetical protein